MYNRFCPNHRPNGGCWEPLCFFSRLPENSGPQRHRFWHTLSYIFSAYVVNLSDPGHTRSGHQVASSDLTSWRVWMLVKATPTEWFPWNYQWLIQVTVSIKCISPSFDIGDQRSGQFCDLSPKCQWEKIEKRLFWTKTILNTFSLKHKITGTIDTSHPESKNCHQCPLFMTLRSLQVMKGHWQFLGNNFW